MLFLILAFMPLFAVFAAIWTAVDAVYRNDVPVDDRYVTAEHRSHDDFGPPVVPQGYCFVLGDRRNNSSDSRHWGYVPVKYIVGKVVYRWWPGGAAGPLR